MAENNVEDIKLNIDRYKELDTVIKDLTNSLDKNSDSENEFKNNFEYIQQDISLLQDKKIAIENLKTEQIKELAEVKNNLLAQGFKFNNKDEITNYKERAEALESWANAAEGDLKKARQENAEAVMDDIDKFYELAHNNIFNTEKDLREISKNITEEYNKQLDFLDSAEDKVINMLKKQKDIALDNIEKELQYKLDAISKEKEAYDKQNDEADYNKSLNNEREALNKLQQEKANAMLDTSQSGLSKVEDYNKQIQEQQDKINDMIRDRQRQANDDKFSEMQDQLSKEAEMKKEKIENEWNDNNLLTKASKAIADGYFESVSGNVVQLKDAMLEYTDKFDKGLSVLGNSIKTKLVSELEQSRDILKDMSNISKELELNNKSISYKNTEVFKNIDSKTYEKLIEQISKISLPDKTPFNFKIPDKISTTNNVNNNVTKQARKVEIQINKPLIEIKGNVDNNAISRIQKELDDFKRELVNEIAYNS